LIHIEMVMHPALKLRHIRLFLAIADGGTLSAAALQLGLSQPALSKSLAETEVLLGGTLFLRQGRRLVLTPEGEVFRRHARQALISLDAAAMAFGPNSAPGTITVGVLPTVSTRFFPLVAARFLAEMPAISLSIETGPHDYLLQKLRDHRIELMVGRMPEATELAGIAFEYLYEEPIVLVARRDHPLSGASVGHVVRNSALILPTRDAIIRRLVNDFLASIDLGDVRPAVETSTLALGRGLLLSADAVWFISRGVVANELASGELITIDHGAGYLAGAVGLAQLQAGTRAPAVGRLVEMLREAALTWAEG
jgi:LysR family transcriptional regulator, pca operon transcriptional activator